MVDIKRPQRQEHRSQLIISSTACRKRHDQLDPSSKLEITLQSRNSNDEGIIRFLEHHIGMGNTSTLEEIIITTRTTMSGATWIPSISRLQRLKSLKLHVYGIHEDCLPAMEEIGRGCPALEELTLGMRTCDINEGIIASFCQHPNLKRLRIGSTSLSPASLMLMTTFSSLEYLYLRCNVPESILKMLHKHISKIVINKLPTDLY